MASSQLHRSGSGPIRFIAARLGLCQVLLGALCLQASIEPVETAWYHSVGVEDGLSQSFVTAMAQDRAGFLWLGTVSGLNRFDGHEFLVFSHAPDIPGSLSSDVVHALHVDSAGRLWVGTQVGLDRYDPSTGQFIHYRHDPDNPRSAAPGLVDAIASDRAGRIWFVSSWFDGMVLQCLDPATGSVTRSSPESTKDRMTLVEVDSADRLWVAKVGLEETVDPALAGVELAVFDQGSDIAEGSLPAARRPVALPAGSGAVIAMAEDRAGCLWFGQEDGGLTRYDPQNGTCVTLHPQPGKVGSLAGGAVQSMAVDLTGFLWVLTVGLPTSDLDAGARLHRVDPESTEVTRINLQPNVPHPSDSAMLHGMMVDRSGVLWLGSNAGGLRYFDASLRNFELHRPADVGGLTQNFVRAICLGRDGLLWIGTPKGLGWLDYRQDSAQDSMPLSVDLPPLPNPDVQAILEDQNGALWIATRRGLLWWERGSGSTRLYRHDPADPNSLADDAVQVIHEDAAGGLWFGTVGRGISVLERSTGRFTHIKRATSDRGGLTDNTIHALLSDHRNRLWVGTGAGLAIITESSGELRAKLVAQDAEQLGRRTVLAIGEDPSEPGVLWIGSEGQGLSRLDIGTGLCRHFTTRNSDLPDDTVYGVLCDRSGSIWMSTNRGLVRYDPRVDAFVSYGVRRQVQSLEFNARAHFQASDGEMFFGGIAGVNSFRPEEIRDNLIPPQVCIARVQVFHRDVKGPDAPFRTVYRHGMQEGLFVFGPYERDLRFEFTALHFSNPSFNRYSYWLEGYDDDWRQPVTLREATYTNLKPGRYTFRVRARSSHGVWSQTAAVFPFVISPPFYATIWFAGSCGIALVAMAFGSHKWRVRHLRRRQRELDLQVKQRTSELRKSMALIEKQARHLQELDQAKSRFFANISHEFRTPLTLTMGPLQDMRDGLYGPLPKDMDVELDLAVKNTRRLLELVEQLLTLARIDAGKLALDTRKTDLNAFLRSVVKSFETLSKKQSVDLALDAPPTPIQLPFDAAKLEHVMFNLLSNALKHVPPEGRVTVRLCRAVDGAAVIDVEDTGPGIRPEDLPHLFDRFHQVEESNRTRSGAGIGLSLARELVELHGGQLEVRSRLGQGTTFTVHLPHEPARSQERLSPGGA